MNIYSITHTVQAAVSSSVQILFLQLLVCEEANCEQSAVLKRPEVRQQVELFTRVLSYAHIKYSDQTVNVLNQGYHINLHTQKIRISFLKKKKNSKRGNLNPSNLLKNKYKIVQ